MVTYYVKLNENYTITAADECKVYNASGVLIATCPANSSINVKAATGMLKLSDENAVLKKAVSESGGTSAECEEHIANADIHVTNAEKRIIATSAQVTGVNNFKDLNYFSAGANFNGATNFTSKASFGATVEMRGVLNVLPLGTTTVMGADAYGLHVSSSGGLQLFGTHFLRGDIFSEDSLKIVSNNLSMYSTDTAAISFDYANKAIFRSMPDDGTEGTYEFQCWQWSDDSHTSKKGAGVKLLKESQVSALEGNSVLNKLELDANYTPKNLGTANAILITDGNGNITASTVISVAELNTLNNNVNNIATKLSSIESRLAALES